MEHIGKIIKQKRLKLNISLNKFAEMLNIEESKLINLEENGLGITEELILKLENILDIDIQNVLDSYNDLHSLEANKKYLELRYAIEMRDNDAMQKCVEECEKIHEFQYGELNLLLNYSKALLAFLVEKDAEKAMNTAMSSLNVENLEEACKKITNRVETNSFYSIFVIIGTGLSILEMKEEKNRMYENLFKHFNGFIFKNEEDKVYRSEFLKRVFITIINNYADSCFHLEQYKKTLELCDIGLKKSFELNKSHMIDFLTHLKVEANYMLGNYEVAKRDYMYLKELVNYSNNSWLISNMNNLIKTKYTLMNNVMGEGNL